MPIGAEQLGRGNILSYTHRMEYVHPLPSDHELGAHLKKVETLLGQLGEAQTRLDATRIDPTEAVFRDPKDVYHQIMVGAVFTAHGFSAHHARALDALLSMTWDEARAFAEALQDDGHGSKEDDADDATMGATLMELVSVDPDRLDAIGKIAEWRRRYDRYSKRTATALGEITEDVLERMAMRPVSKAQLALVRYTCACFCLAFPELANRREGFEWLRDVGANPRYRRVRA